MKTHCNNSISFATESGQRTALSVNLSSPL